MQLLHGLFPGFAVNGNYIGALSVVGIPKSGRFLYYHMRFNARFYAPPVKVRGARYNLVGRGYGLQPLQVVQQYLVKGQGPFIRSNSIAGYRGGLAGIKNLRPG